MRNRAEWRAAEVVSAETVADGVRLIRFAVDGDVPRFDPGSHVNFTVNIDGRATVRTYTALPAPAGQIAIAVKQHAHSRGGSRFMSQLAPGDAIRLTLPENRFELSWQAAHYLLIAGGIGITPIYGMARALAARGAAMRMVYAARSRAQMAFANELEDLLGDRLTLCDSSAGNHIDLAAEFANVPPDTEVYLCGPIGMLEVAKAAWQATGRPASRLRFEVFGDSGRHVEQDFSVDILNLGRRVAVGTDQTLLDALIGAGVDMIYDCQRGECGLCAVNVLERSGEIDHRDVFLSAEEKAENTRMCACVSRLTGGSAVIDIGYRT